MKKFSKILYVHEASEKGAEMLQSVVDLARANHAMVTVCDVIEPLPRNLDHFADSLELIRRRDLQNFVSVIKTNGVKTDLKLRVGLRFIEIIREVIEEKHDIVIKLHEIDDLTGQSLGPTDMHLLRKCPATVWISRSSELIGSGPVLAAIDVDPTVQLNEELNHKILDIAGYLAEVNNNPLHIAHAWEIEHESVLRDKRFNLEYERIDEELEQLRAGRETTLAQLTGHHKLSEENHRLHFRKSSPSELIKAVCWEEKVEIVVMGTIARTGIPGLVIGNTAEKILNSIDSSVITVKPASFVSPVGV